MDGNDYVTRGEFKDFTQRTETRIDNLQKEMHEGFLHVTERIDEGFQRMDDKFQHLTERMDDKFEDVAKQQKEDRKFMLGTAITVAGVAATIIGVVVALVN